MSQKQADLEEPTVDDVFDVGTIANIIQLLKLPDGTVKVLVEGQQRAKINQLMMVKTIFQRKSHRLKPRLVMKKN